VKIQKEMAMGTRREVLRLYKNIMRLGQRWEAADPIETRVEREYIADEARTLFRRNMLVKGDDMVRERMKEAETRLTMATHYGNPYPRPVNIPKFSFSKREGKKIGKAVQKMNDLSRPVYLKSMDEEKHKPNDVL